MAAQQRSPNTPAHDAQEKATIHSPRVSQEKRAAALRAAKDMRQVFSAADKERAASNLHRLLEDVRKNHDLSKLRVAEASGLGGTSPTDSTKRLDTYTLPEGASESRRNRLSKKPAKFFAIAEAVATLLNEPSAPYVCQVFEGCTFGSNLGFLTRWEEDRWARLAEKLRLMGTSVGKKANVRAYWQDAMLVNGLYDHQSDQIQFAPRPLDLVGCTVGLGGYQAHPSELPPAPSVLLGIRPLTDRQLAKLQSSDGEEMEVFAQLSLEVRLALAPIGWAGEPGSMLEFRTRLGVTDDEGTELLRDHPYFDQSEEALEVWEAERAGATSRSYRITGLKIPEAPYREGRPHDFLGWEEINPGLLREIFGNWETHIAMVYAQSAQEEKNAVHSRFEAYTPAYYLDAHLLSGALETDLKNACQHRVEMLARFRSALEAEIANAEAEANSRWRDLETG